MYCPLLSPPGSRGGGAGGGVRVPRFYDWCQSQVKRFQIKFEAALLLLSIMDNWILLLHGV